MNKLMRNFKKNEDPWQEIMNSCSQWNLDEGAINKALSSYDPDTKSFKSMPQWLTK